MLDQLKTFINITKYIPPIIFGFSVVLGMTTISLAKDIKYSISERPDGGYSINIVYSKRHWKPITAEGFFPLEEKSYTVNIVGKGKDWANRNQKGYYYSSEEIQSNKKAWDLGYAWIDVDRMYIYLNLYWVSSPDRLIPSNVNGKYELKKGLENR